MLVRDGRRGSYLAGGILQLILGILFAVCLLPFTLEAFGVDVSAWSGFLDGLGDFPGWIQLYLTNAILLIMFVLNFFALFVHRSASSTFLKLSTLLPIATFAALGLDTLALALSGSSLGVGTLFASEIFRYVVLGAGIASLAFLILGILFIFKNRNNPNRATTYQVMKAVLWLVFFAFSFVLPFFEVNVSLSIGILFGYCGYYPDFFAWYFLIAGIWQLCSSTKWALPIDPGNGGGGYPMAPYGYMPQPFYPAYPPQPPYYPPQGWQPPQGGGYKQGLSEGASAPATVDTGLEEAVLAVEAEVAQRAQQKKLLKEQKKLAKIAEKEEKKQQKAAAAQPAIQPEQEISALKDQEPAFVAKPEEEVQAIAVSEPTKTQEKTASKVKTDTKTAAPKKVANKVEVDDKTAAAKKVASEVKVDTKTVAPKKATQPKSEKAPVAKTKSTTVASEAKPKTIPPFPPAKAPASVVNKKNTKKES